MYQQNSDEYLSTTPKLDILLQNESIQHIKPCRHPHPQKG